MHAQSGSTAKATSANVNRGAVERMDGLLKYRPDLAEKVKRGELKASAALRQMKHHAVPHPPQDAPGGVVSLLVPETGPRA